MPWRTCAWPPRRTGEKPFPGSFYGMVFQDSDVAKWLEAAAYSLGQCPNPALEREVDSVVELLAQVQQEDGYLNSYFTVKEPERKWTNLQEAHELYCAGHLMEAACAYYEATGKDRLLKIMEKNAGCIYRHFMEECPRLTPATRRWSWRCCGCTGPAATRSTRSCAPIS